MKVEFITLRVGYVNAILATKNGIARFYKVARSKSKILGSDSGDSERKDC